LVNSFSNLLIKVDLLRGTNFLSINDTTDKHSYSTEVRQHNIIVYDVAEIARSTKYWCCMVTL